MLKRLLTGLGVTVALGLAILTGGQGVATAHASPGFTYRPGQSIQRGWLCQGIQTGNYRQLHCTAHWHRSGGKLVSDNPAWVHTGGSSSRPATRPAHVGKANAKAPARPASRGVAVAPPFGQCTYYAWLVSGNRVAFTHLGNARDWARNARSRGLPVGYVPRVGATVVYQSGVQGASLLGHVAHVIAVYGNGTFRVAEMNYYGFGGGFGRVSYRVSRVQPGVSFIY